MGHLIGLFPFYIGGAIFFSFLTYTFSFMLMKNHVFALGKYSNSGIDRNTSKKLIQLVKDNFANEQVYLDSDISLSRVAEKLSISPRELSQVINENEQRNFSEFVNHYRIEKAKVLLSDPGHNKAKIATIAYDSGFGNVTSFNLAFKAATQLTPSQYREQFCRS
ncbi:MAG: helix-turn-helix domain-containing protein [Bacteroidota bacterium]